MGLTTPAKSQATARSAVRRTRFFSHRCNKSCSSAIIDGLRPGRCTGIGGPAEAVSMIPARTRGPVPRRLFLSTYTRGRCADEFLKALYARGARDAIVYGSPHAPEEHRRSLAKVFTRASAFFLVTSRRISRSTPVERKIRNENLYCL